MHTNVYIYIYIYIVTSHRLKVQHCKAKISNPTTMAYLDLNMPSKVPSSRV